MSLKENINNILKTVGLKAEEVKLAQMKLEDGITIVEAEEFAPEFSVGIVTEEGIVAMPIGDYTLEDGRLMVVAEEGIIAEVKEVTEEEVTEEVAEEEVEMETESTPVAKKIVESVTKETFFSEVEELKKEITELKKQLEVKNEVELSVDEPSAEPIKFNPENSKTPEVYRYGKSNNQSRLGNIINKLNK